MTPPSVSVVAAAWPDLRGLTGMLEVLEPELAGDCDVTVVTPQPRPPDVERRFPRTGWLELPESLLIPELWAAGIAATHGDVVVTTTTHFRPAPDWIESIRRAHAENVAPAIGGPIDPPETASALAWAVYLLRYSAYPAGAGGVRPVVDLAGDNAAYKRRAIEEHPQAVREGFWERELHRALVAEGSSLLFDPRIRVRQQACFDFSTFFRQRYRHGRQFGRARLRGRPAALGLLAAPLAALLVPGLLLGRTARQALATRRPVMRLLCAVPALAAFGSAWGVGEACGYLSHAIGQPPPARA